jgi:hypothetical protein
MVLIPHERYSYCYEELDHKICYGIESEFPLQFMMIGYVCMMKNDIYEVSTKALLLSITWLLFFKLLSS